VRLLHRCNKHVFIMHVHVRRLAFATLALLAHPVCRAEHDIEFVAEHLPEVAMDNRYATLPVWGESSRESPAWSGALQGAASTTSVATLTLAGRLLSAAAQHTINDHWQAGLFGFYDNLRFSGDRDERPLQTLFAPETPIERPVDAVFTNLDGRALNYGGGFYFSRTSDNGFLQQHRWVMGALWQSVELTDYRFDYEITDGPQTGLKGTIDFDATYQHVVPFAGLEIPRDFGKWTASFHTLVAWPIPRRGVAGHITGPGFDLSGDSASAGNGKHFGDPSVTIGLDVTYRPARLSVDIGTLLTQALLEPKIHDGIDQNLVLSVSWSY